MVQRGTVVGVSTNLRLSEAAAAALQTASRRTGRSQQELLREAVDRYLGLNDDQSSLDRAVAAGLVRPPAPFRDVEPVLEPDEAVTTLEWLGRDDDR